MFKPLLSALLLTTAMTISPAYAHAFLVTAQPGAGATIKTAPKEIALDFTEAVEPGFSSIELHDDAGKRIDEGTLHPAADSKTRLIAPIKALHPGVYDVIWHATSVDTHKTEGHYRFTVATPASAETQTAPAAANNTGIAVTEQWARATAPGATVGVVYLTLLSKDGDKLTSLASPTAQSVSVHDMSMEDGVMRMRPVEGGLDLPAGKPVTLAPGGMHVMLTGLKAPLTQGQKLVLHLVFQKAPAMDVTVPVQGIGAKAPTASEPMHMQ